VDADCRAVLLIGRDAPLIARALEGTPAHVETAGTLDAAIARAVELAEPGDAVLLSPGMRKSRPVHELHRARRALR
jgi:UDP-N-acetylmuramoylalanine--D-glutamate ligase